MSKKIGCKKLKRFWVRHRYYRQTTGAMETGNPKPIYACNSQQAREIFAVKYLGGMYVRKEVQVARKRRRFR